MPLSGWPLSALGSGLPASTQAGCGSSVQYLVDFVYNIISQSVKFHFGGSPGVLYRGFLFSTVSETISVNYSYVNRDSSDSKVQIRDNSLRKSFTTVIGFLIATTKVSLFGVCDTSESACAAPEWAAQGVGMSP